MSHSTTRDRWTTTCLLTVLALIGACAVPEGQAPAEAAGPAPQEASPLASDQPPEAGSENQGNDATENEQPTPRRSGGSLDSDELVGLGELGLLPALLESFGTSIDCDFDDALSTCQ